MPNRSMLRCSGGGGQQQPGNMAQREVAVEDFPLEAIPAPPAQFNTANGIAGDCDELAAALAGENVALIRSPALKGNGHAVAMLR